MLVLEWESSHWAWRGDMSSFPTDLQEGGSRYELLPTQQNVENKIFWHCNGFNVKNWDFGSGRFSTVPLYGFNFQAVWSQADSLSLHHLLREQSWLSGAVCDHRDASPSALYKYRITQVGSVQPLASSRVSFRVRSYCCRINTKCKIKLTGFFSSQ